MNKGRTTVNKIAKFLRQEITYSRLKPGQHVKEAGISKKFNVSRVPVREAFRILQSEGYLEVRHNKGCFVKKVSDEYFIQTSIVYRLLVPELLEKAIPRYNKKTYEKAERVLTKLEKCRDFYKSGYLQWDFAKVIYYPSNMKYLLGVFDDMYRHSIRLLNEFFENKEHEEFKATSHRHFLELCRNNRKKEAINYWTDFIDKIIAQIMLVKKIKTDTNYFN